MMEVNISYFIYFTYLISIITWYFLFIWFLWNEFSFNEYINMLYDENVLIIAKK